MEWAFIAMDINFWTAARGKLWYGTRLLKRREAIKKSKNDATIF
jgi:hypothetical protein